jgi:hypothetical protein
VNKSCLPRQTPLFMLVVFCISPAWSHAHGAKKGAATSVQSLGSFEFGDLRLSAQVTQDNELELEVRVEKRLIPPDPIIGDHVAVGDAIVNIGVSRDGVIVFPSFLAHSEGKAGVYGAHFARLDPGSYRLMVEIKRTGAEPIAAQFPFKLGNVASPEGMNTAEPMMTHPFLSHMGLPDQPGAASVRVTGIRRAGELGSGNDLAIHIEAGLWGPLGIHIRNDAITNDASGMTGEPVEDHGTEVMLMYGFLMNEERSRGLSVFAEIGWPTVQGDSDPVRGGIGLGATFGISNRFLFDGNVHVVPGTKGVEVAYEASFQFRIAERIFLLIENRGEFSKEPAQVYLLPALKVGLGRSPVTFGIGLQIPLTTARHYERQAMFQLDWEF